MSKKNKFENIINDVESSAFNSNNNVDSSAVNTSNDVTKPVFNNITKDNVINNNKTASKTASMSIIVARRQKRK